MKPKLIWGALLSGVLVPLAGLSVYLSLTRIYQVDECQNIYMAKVLAAGQANEFFTNSSLFLLGPLSWLSQKAAHSVELFGAARLCFLGVFWLNLILMAMIAGGRINSPRGLVALVAAATMAPLWDYGFEIRHDNLVLTGMLLTWWAVRVKPMQICSYLIAGAVTVFLLFTAVKAVVYVVPLSLAILAFPPPNFQRPRWQLGLIWLGGALIAIALVRLSYGTGDGWNSYLSVFRGVTNYSASTGISTRFWPDLALQRLLYQTPLLLALSLAACSALALKSWRQPLTALTWKQSLPEVLLLAGSLVALLINPTPFPYNLVQVVPYAFLLAFKYGDTLWNELRTHKRLWPLAGMILLMVHFVPFAFATLRHAEWTNARQNHLMRLAEGMTDPVKDPVYDAIGMVPTRRSINFQWYLHSLNIHSIVNNPGSRLRDMLAARPAAVFIPSYRTSWLPQEDHEFIRSCYLPLAGDFWVLGSVPPAGGGDFAIIHPGRYGIVALPLDYSVEDVMPALKLESGLAITGTLDGKPIPSDPLELQAGTHRLEISRNLRLAIVWVGPQLSEIPNPGPGNPQTLFLNWY